MSELTVRAIGEFGLISALRNALSPAVVSGPASHPLPKISVVVRDGGVFTA